MSYRETGLQTAKVAGVSLWEPDVLPGYQQRTLSLGPDPDGEGNLVATLVRRGDQAPPHRRQRNAVLLVHGFTDYFFHTELAEHFTQRGFAVYALDLHKCGRSWREGQTPHFTTNLSRYDIELERSIEVIAAETEGARVLVYGHSAGGLIVSLWLDRLRRRVGSLDHGISGLVLNSPWLDLHGHAILRSAVMSAALGLVAQVCKRLVLRPPAEGGYGTTLHRDYHGEFDYNLAWKPIGGFPVTAGWLRAIRCGHAELHRGLDVGVPNLILRSDHSVQEVADPDAIQCGDAVLDVHQIARWAGCIGDRTTVTPIADAKHDVFLSVTEPRRAAYRELDRWLNQYLVWSSSTAGATQPEWGARA